MEAFLKSKRFKILVCILIVLLAFMFKGASELGVSTFVSSMLSVITVPFQKVSANISDSVTNYLSKYVMADKIWEENEQLKEQIRELNGKIVDYERYKQENEMMKDFLEMKELYPDFIFETAVVIGRDPNEPFYSFTLDKGSLSGVKANDPVITADGLVGRVVEVGLISSKVVTILDPSINIGAYDHRTRDTGIVTGTVELAEQGMCKFGFLPRESAISVADMVVTSGSDIYPKGLIIGELVTVDTEAGGISIYGTVKPMADIKNLKDVVVIKSFKGQRTE